MDWDGLNLLQSGDTTMAWLGALALAAGCTAIIVAAYIQVQRLRGRLGAFKWSRSRPARSIPSSVESRVPIETLPKSPHPTTVTPPVAQGVAAYRAEQFRTEVQAVPDRLEGPSLDALDGLFRRLQKAAESLEDIAIKSGRAAGASEAYHTLLTGLDVEYLHRQN